MHLLFSETFQVKRKDMPGSWAVEKNSDFPFSAVESTEKSMDLLSPGNKYIPVIPQVQDSELRMTAGPGCSGEGYELIISFRYNISERTGEAVRCIRSIGEREFSLEYGEMRQNVFTVKQRESFELPEGLLNGPVEISLKLRGETLELAFGSLNAVFSTKPARSGRFALSRGHLPHILKVYSFEIFVEKEPACEKREEFSVMLPLEPTIYPVKCDIELKDYGDCIEAGLVFSGGVRGTPPGEGNYYEMRTDILTNPYFKVITAESMDKFILHDGQIVLVLEEQEPDCFYELLYEKPDWPMKRRVRFMRPGPEYCMAVGVDEFFHSTSKNSAQKPSETIFDSSGNELYSGIGLTEKPAEIAFKSQPDKKIIPLLPAADPRYERAVEFAKNNHYFIEGEKIRFTVEIGSVREMPDDFEITLENAYLERLDVLAYEKSLTVREAGVFSFSLASCSCRPLEGLKPGVYHLRCRSTDASVSPAENYCAFEVIDMNPDSPAPPVISGLPYMYTSRTETRGLETDAFDPWRGKSVDEGHYMSCANFLAKCARDNHIAPTVRAYRREWFLWLGSRCCSRPEIEHNADLLAEADYANTTDEMNLFCWMWFNKYKGKILDYVIEFAEQVSDPRLDIDRIKAIKLEGGHLDEDSFRVIARDYWQRWLDFANARFHEQREEHLARLRDINPRIRVSSYGPAPVYASHYKGADLLHFKPLSSSSPRDQGFWQYEDYPFWCRYGIERGTYFLASSLMKLPGYRIYPEIYSTHIGGCPDGAVKYAYPPLGKILLNDPLRIKRRIYDYVFASAHYTANGFEYWREYGFQTGGFDRERYEALLTAWRAVRDYPPERPLKCAAFVYSEDSRRANSMRKIIKKVRGFIIDVREVSNEAVPFSYEMSRRRQAAAGFTTEMDALSGMRGDQAGLLVLPPLKGVPPEHIEAIRSLHARGVNLLCFEDVSGLEDLFGVADTGQLRSVSRLKADENFLNGMEEYCDEPLCQGKYEAAGADVLINAEIPVLFVNSNAHAKAALFNIPPTLVRSDQLHERLTYGKESISSLINAAAGEIVKQLSDSPVSATAGRIIAFKARGGEHVVVVTNPHESDYITPEVGIRKEIPELKFTSCDAPFRLMKETEQEVLLRLKLEKEESAIIVLK